MRGIDQNFVPKLDAWDTFGNPRWGFGLAPGCLIFPLHTGVEAKEWWVDLAAIRRVAAVLEM
jgi:hypothetical protein